MNWTRIIHAVDRLAYITMSTVAFYHVLWTGNFEAAILCLVMAAWFNDWRRS